MKHSPYLAPNRERGFGSVMAVIILVVLASLAVAILKLGATQQSTSSQDLLSSRAWAAARAGNEWGLFEALSSTASANSFQKCANVSQTLDLSATTGFWVTVNCQSWTYKEGESAVGTFAPVTVYVIQATACNSNSVTGCPDAAAATTSGYIERVRQVTAVTPSVATGF
jgi:MSHA biogenesis protein MshP